MNQTENLFSLVLPRELGPLTVAVIPAITAAVIWPQEDAVREVSYLILRKTALSRGQDLTEDEWTVLNDIWRDLPNICFPLPESEWAPYAEAFENAISKPDWHLGTMLNDPDLNRRILRETARKEHEERLEAAIQKGEVQIRSSVTGAPYEPGDSWSDERIKNALVTLEQFINFAATLSIGVTLEIEGQELVEISSTKDDRISAIVKTATNLGFNPTEIPYGGKKKIRDECLQDAKLFTGSTFDKAWQQARDADKIDVVNSEIYRKR